MTALTINSTLVPSASKETSFFCPAKQLDKKQRQQIAEQALSNKTSITELAKENEISRKFIVSSMVKTSVFRRKNFSLTKRNDVF